MNMGCNSSSVIPLGETESTVGGTKIKVRVNPSTPETIKLTSANGDLKRSNSRRSSTPPLESSEPPVETLNKDFNSSGDRPVKTAIPPPPPPPPPPPLPPLAFDVPINEESIIKKHPPKKFRRVSSQQIDTSKVLTHEELNNKLQEAETRRREILNQRIQSAQLRNSQIRQLIHADAISQKSEENMDPTVNEEKKAW